MYNKKRLYSFCHLITRFDSVVYLSIPSPRTPNVTRRISSVVHVGINPGIHGISQITLMRSRIRASHTSHTSRTRTLNAHVAVGIRPVVLIRIYHRIELVCEIRLVVSRIGRTCCTRASISCTRTHSRRRIRAVISV
jgi:hypothetical protein